jgi:hypothetical protein
MPTLSNTWKMYEHPPGTKSWSLDSYKVLGTFKTSEEIASVIHSITIDTDRVSGAYLCLMKNDIPPVYESSENKNGGAFTIRIPTENAQNTWSTFVAHAICDELLHTHNDKVAGLIISPKRGNIVLQIWTTEKIEKDAVNPVLSNMISSEIMYRSHFERI